ncbi:MAG: hypothetical protein AAF674_14760 [Pseudomonadota bacterium]
MINRRHLLAGAAALAAPAWANGFPDNVPDGLVFFVGNSFTRQHGVPALVCRLARHDGAMVHCHPHTANGAHLWDLLDFVRAMEAERTGPIKGTVVLQDHSTAPLTTAARKRSAEAMARFSALFEGTVLFQTWPRQAGHSLYGEPGMPTTPADMVAAVDAHYMQQADRLGARVARVGMAWMAATQAGINLFARDGYHANAMGAWLAALMLTAALEIADPYTALDAADPYPDLRPDGLSADATRDLIKIARRYT